VEKSLAPPQFYAINEDDFYFLRTPVKIYLFILLYDDNLVTARCSWPRLLFGTCYFCEVNGVKMLWNSIYLSSRYGSFMCVCTYVDTFHSFCKSMQFYDVWTVMYELLQGVCEVWSVLVHCIYLCDHYLNKNTVLHLFSF